MTNRDLCDRQGQQNNNNKISKVKIMGPQFYTFSMLNTLFSYEYYKVQKSNHCSNIQQTKLYCHAYSLCSFVSSSQFLIPTYPYPQITFHSLLPVTIMVIYAFPSQFPLNLSYQSSPLPCSQSSTDHFNVLFPTLLEGSRRYSETVSKVYSSVRQCPRPSASLTTHSLARTPSSPASCIHGKCPLQVYHILSFI